MSLLSSNQFMTDKIQIADLDDLIKAAALANQHFGEELCWWRGEGFIDDGQGVRATGKGLPIIFTFLQGSGQGCPRLRATFSPAQLRVRRDALFSLASTVSSCAFCEQGGPVVFLLHEVYSFPI
jgi:hypothetical protein